MYAISRPLYFTSSQRELSFIRIIKHLRVVNNHYLILLFRQKFHTCYLNSFSSYWLSQYLYEFNATKFFTQHPSLPAIYAYYSYHFYQRIADNVHTAINPVWKCKSIYHKLNRCNLIKPADHCNNFAIAVTLQKAGNWSRFCIKYYKRRILECCAWWPYRWREFKLLSDDRL